MAPSIHIQGDVIIRPIKSIPAEAKPLNRKELAYGEVTGHSHSIADLTAAQLLADHEKLYMVVNGEGGVEIRHEEHAPHHVDKGNYEIIQQVEDTEWGAQKVVD